MHRTRNFLVSIALIAAVFSGYWIATREDSRTDDKNSDAPRQKANQYVSAETVGPLARPVAEKDDLDASLNIQDDVTDCLSPEQLDSDPALVEEYARFESLVTSDPVIESYRGLSAAELAGLADQGDSAAMAVLGANSIMRAMKLPVDQAVSHLLLQNPSLELFNFEQPLESETVQHLQEASDWFYSAAVHGRLLALQNVGEITAIIGGTPSELGWISQDEYESLERFERHALDPANVYGALAFEIAPGLIDSPLGAMTAELTPGGDRQQLLLHGLAWQFRRDREAARLPPIDIPTSTAPSLAEIESLMCEP